MCGSKTNVYAQCGCEYTRSRKCSDSGSHDVERRVRFTDQEHPAHQVSHVPSDLTVESGVALVQALKSLPMPSDQTAGRGAVLQEALRGLPTPPRSPKAKSTMRVDFYMPLELPYDAPVDIVPPTHAEIMASQNFIRGGSGSTIVRVRHQFIAKYGSRVDPLEGENMLWVEQNTSLRIPKLYRMYRYDGNKTMLIMEYIPGKTLRDILPSMSEAMKRLVGKHLRSQINELRSLSVERYYGSIGERPYNQKTVSANVDGPFADFDKVVRNRFGTFHTNKRSKRLDELRDEYVRSYVMATPDAFRSVFTHADLHDGNVILQMDGTPMIIDWETAGFYPTYEEYLHGHRLNESIPFLESYSRHLFIEGETIRALRRLRLEERLEERSSTPSPEETNELGLKQCEVQ
ncbi:kinase-like domain-containing protein [Xylariaceae sp. FL1019]|nr:kinase-like domain-containing protein [Xylariaceae sp. FL1019]